MYQAKSKVAAERAEKYVDMLSHHFGRKAEVEKGVDYSEVTFAMGRCRMSAINNELTFLCEAESDTALQTVRTIIDRHIPLLKHIKDAELEWSFETV